MQASTIVALIAMCTIAGCGSPDQNGNGASATDAQLRSKVAHTTSAMRRGGVVGSVESQMQMADAPAPAIQADAVAPEAPPAGADPFQGIDASTAAPTMVIRTGQAFIEVDKVDPAILKIRQLAAQVGGYITNSSISGGRDQIRQATLELKIPAPRYDDAVGSLSSIGKVETVNSNAQDVGEEFVDVTARVTNSKRLEERLINLLATRTGKLEDVLRVERELARVREEIERYEGRLRYLSARAAMSTLSITVHEPAPILGSSPGENPLAAAMRRAWRNFIALLAGSIAALGVLVPLALVALGVWYGYRRWRKN
jgi:Domain of unknown function (DUF4349)